MLEEITQSLSNLAEEINKLEVENSMAQIIKNRVTFTTSYGKKRLWESYTVPFSFGKNKEKSTISVAQDITGIITNQVKQSKITNTLDLLMEETNSGKWSWDLVTNKIDTCRHGRSIIGLDNSDGSYQSFLGSIHPEARYYKILSLIEVIKSGKVHPKEYRSTIRS